MKNHQLRTVFIFTVLFLLAACLRYYGCFSFPYDGDEAFSMQRSQDYAQFFKTGDLSLVQYSQVNPLFIVNSLILPYFKTPEAAVRTLPLIAGISFFAIFPWLLGRPYGYTVALSSLAILAFNPTHIFFSQYGRYFSLIFLLANLSLFTFLRSYETRSFKLFVVSLIFAILAFLEHPGVAMIFPAEIAFLFFVLIANLPEEKRLYDGGDFYMVRVGITFATALVPVAIFSIYVLLKWKSISGGASIGGVISYFGGIFMRLGAPLSVCSVIASCYFVFRRDIVGIFLAFATFGPILAGGVISMLGMDVNPYYVAYVIFPAIVLCCSFICKLFSLRTADQPATALPFYEIALCTATVSLFIVGSIAELTSHYIDGGRHDWPTAVRWLDKEHGKGGTIAVCQSPGFLVDYCRLSGIPYAIFPADKPLDDIIEAMQSGRFVVMPYVWWATLADGDLDRLLQVPHRIILKAERDGLTPILPTRIRLESYGTEFTNAGRDLKNLVMSKYELKNRIGKTRLDYGQNYLLIYGVRGEASKD